LVLSPTGLINLGFTIEGRLAAVLIIPSLGVPNWSVIYINTAPSSFMAARSSLYGTNNISLGAIESPRATTMRAAIMPP
jgi:hypothetical protein